MAYAIIMAGGSGTRFWPESRKSRPKQLLKMVQERSMIRATMERLSPLIPLDRIMVVTGSAYGDEIRKELPELDESSVVEEPVGRNTAACIALAAYKLTRHDPEAVMAVLPADHVISNEKRFLRNLEFSFKIAAEKDLLVTFGIKPCRPETGYGYIELGPLAVQSDSGQAFDVERFVEKPDLETARHYLALDNYLWNSGMFVWKVSTIIRAFEKHLPMISQSMREISPVLNTPEESTAIEHVYQEIQSISIDNGIMEVAHNVVVIPVDVGWSDVGTWGSLPEVWGTDAMGNSVRGQVVIMESKGCVVSSPHKLAAILGVEDLVVVDTADAILICHKDRSQDVKKLQEVLTDLGYTHLL